MDNNDIERFWNKVSKQSPDECWNWNGVTQSMGYGMFWLDYKMHLAHRVAYRIQFKKFPIGNLMHTCDNPLCVNPGHLVAGSQSDNIADMFNKGRQVNQHGERGPRAKLTKKDVLKIRELKSQGATNVELGKLYNVHPGTISSAYLGKNWSHI